MEQTLKEIVLERTTETDKPAAPFKLEDLDERIIAALTAADDKKAIQTIVLDLRGIADFTDFFIITSGTNTRQVQAIADGVSEDLKKNMDSRPTRIEGYNTADWILLDYGDFVMHVFDPKTRSMYDLERLWRDARRFEFNPQPNANPIESDTEFDSN